MRFPLAACLLFTLFFANVARAERQPGTTEREARIGDGIALFVPTGYKPQRTPSLAFASPLRELGTLEQTWKLVPEFFLEDGKAGATLAVPAGASRYGTGDVTGPLLRNGQKITLWNTDNYAYTKAGGKRL